MKKVSILVLMSLFCSCSKKEEEVSEVQKPYIISEENKPIIRNNDTVPPPPPIPGWLVYGTNTFVFDKNSKIYYFQRNKMGYICGGGVEEIDTVPYFIDLQPKDLIEIPDNSIGDFVALNYKKEVRNITLIASELDTLKTNNYYHLIRAIKKTLGERDLYFVKRTTQEIDTVLSYKRNDAFYDSKEIKWDASKIRFPEAIKFVKPKVR